VTVPEHDAYAPPKAPIHASPHDDATPASTLRMRVIAVFVVTTLLAVGFAFYLSLDPGRYFRYSSQSPADWRWDPLNVAIVCAVMAAEGAFACLLMVAAKPASLALRCLGGLVVLVPWSVMSLFASMHMPQYVLFHHLWVCALTLIVALMLIMLLTAATYRRIRR
jgi:hypothetical protein